MIKNKKEYQVTCKAYEKLHEACKGIKAGGFKTKLEELGYQGLKSQCQDLKDEINEYKKNTL